MGWGGSAEAEAGRGQLEAIVRLHQGDPHVAGTLLAVELTGADERTSLTSEPFGEGPGIAVGSRRPQVEAALGHRRFDTDGRQHLDAELESSVIPLGLFGDVGLVGERSDSGGLDRTGRHEPGVFADLAEVVDQVGVAGEEAGPGTGEIRALRQ